MIWQFPTYTIGTPLDWSQLTNQFDWIKDMKEIPQDPFWHREGNVYIHTQMVVEALIRLPEFATLSDQEKHILVAAAVLHDVEKRSTTISEVIDGQERIVSPKHAKIGEFTARNILYKEIPTPFPIREQIAKLVRLHGLPIWAIEKENPVKEVIYASLVVNTKHLALLAEADMRGRICADQEAMILNIDLFRELCLENNCYGHPKSFGSNYGRFLFFNKAESSPDYVPFEDRKFDVVVMSGLPGTGKDTFIKKQLDLPILSLDDIRRAHQISPTDKKKNGQVIQLAKEQAKVYMRKRTSFVFNATNITKDVRGKWIQLFLEYGAKVKIIYLEVPYRQLIRQNRNREYQVPEMVMERLIRKLEIPSYREAHEVEYVVES